MYKYLYIAEIHGISLGQEFVLKDIAPMLHNSTIKQHSQNKVIISVLKARTWPEEIAMNEAILEVEDLVDRLSLLDNHRITSLKYFGYEDDNGNPHEPDTLKKIGLFGTLEAGIPNPLLYYADGRQKKILVGKINPGLTRLHRVAQGMPNGVGKYMLLYGALQVLYGEKQKLLDAKLLEKRPDTLMVQGKHRPETIISRIRNQIAHPENNVNVQTLFKQAEDYCPMLTEILRQELSDI